MCFSPNSKQHPLDLVQFSYIINLSSSASAHRLLSTSWPSKSAQASGNPSTSYSVLFLPFLTHLFKGPFAPVCISPFTSLSPENQAWFPNMAETHLSASTPRGFISLIIIIDLSDPISFSPQFPFGFCLNPPPF